ncbi:MAG: histidinol-phosphatase [Leptospiraceae bacterium]|nr:histidinol-phosphatase [Leptospiraceae bacterium]MCP5495975.1 histidinol-phosphatase [Leptospiraceae bacterium]
MKNYHTHTFRCKHASGDVKDYVKVAIENGITVLGISDHTPLPDNRWLNVRMHFSELGNYVNAIISAKSEFTQIKILKGMECEYAKEYHSFYQEKLLGEYGFDYLIGAPHYFTDGNEWKNTYGDLVHGKDLIAYGNYVVESMQSGLFRFIAHPDLFGNSYLPWDENTIACSKDILQAAEELKIPLEINGLGFRKPRVNSPKGKRRMYPLDEFWELASGYNISVVLNSDAHRPQDVAASIDKGLAMAQKYQLKIADLADLEE